MSVLLVSHHLSRLYLADAAMCDACTCKPCNLPNYIALCSLDASCSWSLLLTSFDVYEHAWEGQVSCWEL